MIRKFRVPIDEQNCDGAAEKRGERDVTRAYVQLYWVLIGCYAIQKLPPA